MSIQSFPSNRCEDLSSSLKIWLDFSLRISENSMPHIGIRHVQNLWKDFFHLTLWNPSNQSNRSFLVVEHLIFLPCIGNMVIPSDEIVFFRGVGSTTRLWLRLSQVTSEALCSTPPITTFTIAFGLREQKRAVDAPTSLRLPKEEFAAVEETTGRVVQRVQRHNASRWKTVWRLAI